MKTLITVSIPANISSFSAGLIEKSILKDLKTQSTLHLVIGKNAVSAKEAEQLKSADEILFTSFHPPTKELLSSICESSDASLSFIVYGNFTELASFWLEVENLLFGRMVMFYVLSSAHKIFLQQFIGQMHVEIMRPSGFSDIAYREHDRNRLRKIMKVPEEGKVFLYTGRLSLQKQIHVLLDSYSQYAVDHPLDELWLAGNFDDLGDPYFNVDYLYGNYEQRIYQQMNSLSPMIRKRVKFIPFQKRSVLSSLYSAADVGVSLSIHHDEDFGVSMFEAQQSGLPLICSAWGGHLDLESAEIKFLKVHETGKLRTLRSEEVADSFRKIRPGRVFPAINTRGLVTARNFSGYLPAMSELASFIQKKTPGFFTENVAFYQKIYQCYYGGSK